MTNHGSNEHPELVVQHFDANTELNDYEVKPSPPPPPPRSFVLRSGPRISYFFLLVTLFTDPLGLTRFDRG